MDMMSAKITHCDNTRSCVDTCVQQLVCSNAFDTARRSGNTHINIASRRNIAHVLAAVITTPTLNNESLTQVGVFVIAENTEKRKL